MERLRVKYPIIVEGRYDKARLASLIEGDILQTDGFQVFSNKKKLALIRRLAAEEKVVILTDSDRAGFRIRGYLAGAIPPEQVLHVYIPQVQGKERRKRRPSAEGTLGVEGMETEVLYALGFSGGERSAVLRRALLKRLELPEGIGANALPGVLTRLVSPAQLEELAKELRQEIF